MENRNSDFLLDLDCSGHYGEFNYQNKKKKREGEEVSKKAMGLFS